MMPTSLFALTLSHHPQEEFFFQPLITSYLKQFQFDHPTTAEGVGQNVSVIYQFLLKNSTWHHEMPTVSVEMVVDNSCIQICFHDKALPWPQDWINTEIKTRALADRPIYIDQLIARNLGKLGRSLETIIRLPTEATFVNNMPDKPLRNEDTANATIVYRLLDSAEAHKAVDCLYISYGYDYGIPDVYSEPETRRLMEQQMVYTLAAEAGGQEVVGITTVRKRHATSQIFDLCQTVVKPQFIGNKIFGSLLPKIVEFAEHQLVCQGISATIPNKHYVSQKILTRLGFIPTGILLGCVPAIVMPKQLGTHLSDRDAFLMAYRPNTPIPFETIYAPERHQPVIQKIGQRIAFTPTILPATHTTPPDISQTTRFEVENLNWVIIQVDVCGADIAEQIYDQLEQLRLRQFRAIQLYLDLTDPVAAGACGQLEALGFFFAGFLPDEKPWLVLQHLNAVALEFDDLDYPMPGADFIQAHIEQEHARMVAQQRNATLS